MLVDIDELCTRSNSGTITNLRKDAGRNNNDAGIQIMSILLPELKTQNNPGINPTTDRIIPYFNHLGHSLNPIIYSPLEIY